MRGGFSCFANSEAFGKSIYLRSVVIRGAEIPNGSLFRYRRSLALHQGCVVGYPIVKTTAGQQFALTDNKIRAALRTGKGIAGDHQAQPSPALHRNLDPAQ